MLFVHQSICRVSIAASKSELSTSPLIYRYWNLQACMRVFPSKPTLASDKFSPARLRTAQIARHLSSSSSYHSPPASSSNMASPYKTRKVARPNTLEHRIYIEKDGVPISPFHDIPLYANEQQTILNMIVEIPRWTNGKMEVSLILYPLISSTVTLPNPAHRPLIRLPRLDLQGGTPQPHQARRQEGQASVRAQLLPTQGISLELWCFPSGATTLSLPKFLNV
jgi:hypothetical protein